MVVYKAENQGIKLNFDYSFKKEEDKKSDIAQIIAIERLRHNF